MVIREPFWRSDVGKQHQSPVRFVHAGGSGGANSTDAMATWPSSRDRTCINAEFWNHDGLQQHAAGWEPRDAGAVSPHAREGEHQDRQLRYAASSLCVRRELSSVSQRTACAPVTGGASVFDDLCLAEDQS